MNVSLFKFISKLAVVTLCVFSLMELGLALWTILESQYKSLAYNLADVGYIDLWILRYLSMCLFASSIITLVMCLILIWGLYSTHVFIFIASTMTMLVIIAEFSISIITFTNKFQTKQTLQDQLPKLVITYRQGNDERANRALDILQSTFRCCGSDGRLSFQNNVPLSCNMYNVGCLTRTLYFLDSCMDFLAYILLIFSVIKLLIIIYFYSFICIYQWYRREHPKKEHHIVSGTRQWRNSSSFESSSTDNLPKKILVSSVMADQEKSKIHESEFIEKKRIVPNDYDSQVPSKRVQNAAMILQPTISTIVGNPSAPSYEQQVARKLSSISEKTEKTETDDSEPDLLRIKQYFPKRKPITTVIDTKSSIPLPPSLPKKLPIIKNRRRIRRDDDNDIDSGVERSSSEKSFEDQIANKRHSDTSTSVDSTTKPNIFPAKATVKSPPILSFSNVFVTSVSQGDIREQLKDDEVKKPFTASPSSSSSLSDHLLLSEVTIPKPILKKSAQQSSPSSDQDRIPPSYQDQKKMSSVMNPKSYIKLTEPSLNTTSLKTNEHSKIENKCLLPKIPKPAPRPSLKQSSTYRKDESLV